MAKAKFQQLNAMIWVRNVPDAIAFYTGKLGFAETYSCHNDEGELDFAIVERDGIEFHLQICACEDGRHTGNTFIEIVVEDIAAMSAECEAADVEFLRCLTEEDWGSSFKIADPDGNWILFTHYH